MKKSKKLLFSLLLLLLFGKQIMTNSYFHVADQVSAITYCNSDEDAFDDSIYILEQ